MAPSLTTSASVAVLAFAAVLFLLLVLARCHHGLDFTDEGYALNAIADPWLYAGGVTQFGAVYHPLFTAAAGDIALMRQFNVLLTWFMSLALAWCCVASFAERSSATSYHAALSVCLAQPSLLYLSSFWIPTPNYNSLTLQGLLVVALGFALRGHAQANASLPMYCEALMAALLGIGAALVFLAKPSSTVLLAVAALPGFVVVFRRRALMMAVSTVAALGIILTVGLALDGNLAAFVSRYQRGLEFARELVPAHAFFGMLRFELLDIPRRAWYGLSSLGIAAFVILFLTRTRGNAFAFGLISVLALGGAFGTIALIAKPELAHLPPRVGGFSNAIVIPPLLATIAFVVGFGWRRVRELDGHRTFVVASFLFVCPYLYAFGTGNRVTTQALGALVFWPIAIVQLARRALPEDKRLYVHTFIAVVLVPTTAWLVTNSMRQPYRQNTALHLQLDPVPVGPSSAAVLLLDAEAAKYLRDLRSSVPAGFERLRGQPMLDFTGSHPGTLYALGAKAIGLPWMIGGYRGSTTVVDRAIARIPCEVLARAWLLTAPEGPRAVPVSLLTRHGLKYSGPAAGSFAGPWRKNASMQHLMAPETDASTAAARCIAFRRSRPP